MPFPGAAGLAYAYDIKKTADLDVELGAISLNENIHRRRINGIMYCAPPLKTSWDSNI
jgi:hypothetical protein